MKVKPLWKAGVLFHLFAGQPLTIIGSTGPILIFERICYALTSSLELNYLEFRLGYPLKINHFEILLYTEKD